MEGGICVCVWSWQLRTSFLPSFAHKPTPLASFGQRTIMTTRLLFIAFFSMLTTGTASRIRIVGVREEKMKHAFDSPILLDMGDTAA